MDAWQAATILTSIVMSSGLTFLGLLCLSGTSEETADAVVPAELERAVGAMSPDPVNRAKELLRRLLTPEQRQEYERTGSFRVRGKMALYHLTPHGRVHAILPNGSEAAICTQFVDYAVPDPDLLIAKLLMIRTQENAIWAYPYQWIPPCSRVHAILPDCNGVTTGR